MKEILFGRRQTMKELKEYYNQWQRRMFTISYIIWFVLILLFLSIDQEISDFLICCASNPDLNFITKYNIIVWEQIFSFIAEFFGPLSISFGIYNRIMNYIDTKGWKKKFPHLNIDGTWNDITIYTKKMDSSGMREITDKQVPSPVNIKQTCNSFTIEQSIGDDFKWYSLMADWKDNELMILYRVEYNSNLQKENFPEERIGYECMSIKDYGENRKPISMVGKFHHCINDDNKPIYMGDVIYKR